MFDPLHKWLGIPPSEQPPNHYRLLGIAIFENDREVIDAAADKQLSFLHDMTNGEYGEFAEQLSNQVSAARLCLLNIEKKAPYDSSLRNQLQRSAADPVASETTPENTPTVEAPDRMISGAPVQLENDASRIDRSYTVPPISESNNQASVKVGRKQATVRRRGSAKKYVFLSTLLCGVMLVLVGVGVYQGRLEFDFAGLESILPASMQPSTETPTAATNPSHSASFSANTPEAGPSTSSQQTTAPSSRPAPASSGSDTKGHGESPTRSDRASSSSPSSMDPATPPLKPRSLGDLLHAGSSSSESMPIVMQPLPSNSQLEEKMDLIRELYEVEYQDAQTPQKRFELAQQMHREGQQTVDDSVGRYALWKVARDIMTRDGNFTTSLRIADNMQSHYHEVDGLLMKVQTLKNVEPQITSSNCAEYLETTADVLRDCIKQERFPLALSLCDLIKQKMGKRATATQIASIDQFIFEIDSAELALEKYELALNTLQTTVEDPAANQTAGRFLCFVREDWQAGLPYLLRGSEPSTQTAAKLEASTESDSPDVIDVADAWFDIAESEEGNIEQTNIYRHALNWYRRAQEINKGLQRRKIDSRITNLERLLLAGDKTTSRSERQPTKALQYRIQTSKDSRSDFADRKGNVFTMGMGSRPDGHGEAMAGIELENAKEVTVVGSASANMDLAVDAFSKTGFLIDYHTPGGYVKRVFLGLGLKPGRQFTDAPGDWGTMKKPDVVTDIGRENTYEIDLRRWAPNTWDGRCWFTIYMQNAGPNRTITATVSW